MSAAKRWMAAVLTLCAAAVWAGGGKENADAEAVEQEPGQWAILRFVAADGTATRECRARQSFVMGSNVVELTGGADAWTHRVLKDGIRWVPATPDAAVRTLAEAAVDETWSTLSPTEAFALSNTRERQGSSADLAKLTSAAGFAMARGCSGLVLTTFGEARTCRVLLGKTGSNSYAGIAMDLPGDFFPGEVALLGDPLSDTDYLRKASAFMNTFFAPDAEREAFQTNVVKAHGLTGVSWAAYANAADLASLQRKFLNAFQLHLKVTRESVTVGTATASVPVLEWPEGSFDAVYGSSVSGYTSGWLRYCYETGKPVLAGLINTAVAGAGVSGYLYNWQEHQALSAAEGREVATAALRYLTWGPDYVLPGGAKGGQGFTAQAITSDADLVRLRGWVLESLGTDPLKDYLPGAAPTAVPAATLVAASARYAPEAAGAEGALGAVAALTTTPYSVPGNPAAYVPGGVDTPRTFAYKVFEQKRTFAWLNKKADGAGKGLAEAGVLALARLMSLSAQVNMTTKQFLGDWAALKVTAGATGTGVLDYAEPTDVVKPYRAGVEGAATGKGVGAAPGLNDPDRSAGVDAAGLLGGALAMSGVAERVLSVNNAAFGANVRAYSAMVAGSGYPGLDADTGRPIYHAVSATGTDSVRTGSYRFTRTDIERMTVLVPDLSLAQLGDLVVGPGQGDRCELGIVVGTTGTPASRSTAGFDPRAEREKIIVLSVNATVGHVFVGPWKAGTFEGNADGFQLRRIVRLKPEENLGTLSGYPAGEVDLVTKDRGQAYLKVTYARDEHATARTKSAQQDHRIPNTGEMLKINSIELKRIGEPIRSDARVNAEIVGLRDYGYAAGHGGNVAVNGGGGFELYALFPKDERELLGTFTHVANQELYTYAAASSPQALVVRGGKVLYKGVKGETGQFGLVALDPRPGDDVLLRVRMWQNSTGTVLEADKGDFAVVYDKKLLWRANLYMAEAGRDWNDLNPWQDMLGGDNWTPVYGDTGQNVAVAEITWPGDNNYHVEGAVAYSINCHDSPAEYNGKMEEQRLILKYLIQHHKLGYAADVPLKPENNPPKPEERPGWETTTAPPKKQDPFVGGPGVWAIYADSEAIAQLAAGETARPYRPGYFSEWYGRSPGDFDTTANPNAAANITKAMQQSAGVDCVGLVQRSASYPGNPYSLSDVEEYGWDSAEPWDGRRFIVTQEDRAQNWEGGPYDLWRITAKTAGDPPNLDKVVPGDIVYYIRANRSYHVMVVGAVKHTPGRQVTMADIQLIEAVYGSIGNSQTDRVVAVRNLRQLNELDDRSWRLGRPTLNSERGN